MGDNYFRSSAAYRVRIALQLKRLKAEIIPVHLLKAGGEQHAPAYQQINPSELVPTFTDQHYMIGQSLSILEYLEEQYPEVMLLPEAIHLRAQIRTFCLSIACDIHPLNNLQVLQYLKTAFNISDTQKTEWYRHWMLLGMQTLEAQLSESNRQFCFGDQATLADCCLIPHVYNAKRFQIDLSEFSVIDLIYQHCMTLVEFQKPAPEQQPDAA